MGQLEMRIAGFGGQGVILAGIVIGRAASIYDTKHVTLTQSFGPEARGSASSVQLIISSEPILYPYLNHSDVLVAMSQEAYTRFVPDLKAGGLLLYEKDLIALEPLRNDIQAWGIPATRLAEELGRKLVLNMVMVGFVTALAGLPSPLASRQSIAHSVPKGSEALNIAAYQKGLDYGLSLETSLGRAPGASSLADRWLEGAEDFVRS